MALIVHLSYRLTANSNSSFLTSSSGPIFPIPNTPPHLSLLLFHLSSANTSPCLQILWNSAHIASAVSPVILNILVSHNRFPADLIAFTVAASFPDLHYTPHETKSDTPANCPAFRLTEPTASSRTLISPSLDILEHEKPRSQPQRLRRRLVVPAEPGDLMRWDLSLLLTSVTLRKLPNFSSQTC